MYEYVIGIVNLCGFVCITNVIWYSGCALALGVEGHGFKPWWAKNKLYFC